MHLSSIEEGDETEEEGPAKPTSQKFAKISHHDKMAERAAAMKQKFLKPKPKGGNKSGYTRKQNARKNRKNKTRK